MARIRSINPCAPVDEDVATMTMAARYVWAYLPCHADKEGRLRDAAFTLKLAICPLDQIDVEAILVELAARRHIIRYEVDGRRYIQIRNFAKHQKPHIRETDSRFPAPQENNEQSQPVVGAPPKAVEGKPKAVDAALDPGPGSGVLDPGPEISLITSEDPKPESPELPTGSPNALGLARTFGQVRSQQVAGTLSWQVPKNVEDKAAAIVDAIAADPRARADVIPSMVLFFKKAKSGEIGSNGKAVSDPTYGFACWCSAFTSLREELGGRRLTPSAGVRAAGPFYPKLSALPAGVLPPPRPAR